VWEREGDWEGVHVRPAHHRNYHRHRWRSECPATHWEQKLAECVGHRGLSKRNRERGSGVKVQR
jgi:hypothetical protein